MTRRLLVALSLIALALVTAPARTQGLVVLAIPASFAAGYATPVVPVQKGGELDFLNLDVADHDVIAIDAFGADDRPWCGRFAKGQCPVFWSKLVALGEQTPVLGLDQIQSGKSYAFVCSIHGNMKGTLAAT